MVEVIVVLVVQVVYEAYEESGYLRSQRFKQVHSVTPIENGEVSAISFAASLCVWRETRIKRRKEFRTKTQSTRNDECDCTQRREDLQPLCWKIASAVDL
jgi:hypothetical protein